MISIIERFLKFLRRERTKSVLAFLLYSSVILMALNLELPIVANMIGGIIQFIVVILWNIAYLEEISDERLSTKKWKHKLTMIGKEIVMFIPILLITSLITKLLLVGESANQASIDSNFKNAPIMYSLLIIIFGPIIEEFIFRLLPAKFIKNRFMYIIISTVVFAAMHVVGDPKAYYYIWFYMMRPLYYGYRYYETKNIWVPISMHSLNNLIATLPQIMSYF